jgi:iron(III) transport system substrate-binding protein
MRNVAARAPSTTLRSLTRVLGWSPSPAVGGEERAWPRLLLVFIFLAVATGAQAQTIADIANFSGPDRTQKLIDGARKEGAVTLYSSAVIDDTNAIAAAFEKKYGVSVKLWRGSSEDILRRAVTEHRGGRDDVDVAETAGPDMEGLRREQLLHEMTSPIFADLIPQAVVPHRPWVTSRLSIFTAAFNTALIKPNDVPKTYDDLTDPQWQGKLGVEADDGNWFMSVADAMGEDKAVALFRKIVATNGISVRKGHTLLSNLVVAGEVPLALTVYGYRINELKVKGAPIDGVVLPPAVALPTGIAVFAKAPHPNAAALFMDFFLSDGQRILAERGNVPTNRTVQAPPPGLTFVDAAQFLDQGDKWTRLFKGIFAGARR